MLEFFLLQSYVLFVDLYTYIVTFEPLSKIGYSNNNSSLSRPCNLLILEAKALKSTPEQTWKNHFFVSKLNSTEFIKFVFCKSSPELYHYILPLLPTTKLKQYIVHFLNFVRTLQKKSRFEQSKYIVILEACYMAFGTRISNSIKHYNIKRKPKDL